MDSGDKTNRRKKVTSCLHNAAIRGEMNLVPLPRIRCVPGGIALGIALLSPYWKERLASLLFGGQGVGNRDGGTRPVCQFIGVLEHVGGYLVVRHRLEPLASRSLVGGKV